MRQSLSRYRVVLAAAAALALVTPVEAHRATVPVSPTTGVASWYGGRHAGQRTASGETYMTCLRTAAHRDLPFGTVVLVTNLKNGRSSVVKVNDRGPFAVGRLIDLSERAARDLAMLGDGLASVRIEILSVR
jgi:rare lipoprotein A